MDEPSALRPEDDPHAFPWAATWPEITDPRVRAAFAHVPRLAFVPEELRPWAHQDAPLPIGEGQTISQPFVVALMTQALHPVPGARILEIGTGSGYQTAILCELARTEDAPPGSTVYTIERYPSLQRNARAALARLGYYPHAAVRDGAGGWPEAAPFDGIVVTAAAAHLPRPLCDQLAEGGHLVIPLGSHVDDQQLWDIVRLGGALRRRLLGPVRFVPLVSPLLDDPRNRVEFE
jgi:protein-L-isoaspartate(D-aspartate) O-methyltransferase